MKCEKLPCRRYRVDKSPQRIRKYGGRVCEHGLRRSLREDLVHKGNIVNGAITVTGETVSVIITDARPQPAPRDLDTLEELVHLVVRELLAERREHVSQFSDANSAVAILVKYSKAADEVVCALSSVC